jgi:hypothetical protein
MVYVCRSQAVHMHSTSLTVRSFRQTLSAWRVMADDGGCLEAAVDLAERLGQHERHEETSNGDDEHVSRSAQLE